MSILLSSGKEGTDMAEREGGCVCGAVRYRIEREPIFVHCCHCTDCQRLSGSAFAVNALIESTHVSVVAGAPERTGLATPSGGRRAVVRCASCGAMLWAFHPKVGDKIAFVRVGTLDDPAALPPQLHCFTRSKLPWVSIPEGVAATWASYDPADRWAPDTCARLAAALR